MVFNLAPLALRRNIAMLGMIHRAALKQGPPQLMALFFRRTGSTVLNDPYESSRPPLVRRSVWALIPVYNRLGSGARSIEKVKDFQMYLQERVKTLPEKGLVEDWRRVYCPR